MTMPIFLIFAGIFLIIATLYILVPLFFGPPSVPTRPERIRKALQLANLQPDEVLYDLGAGDGRALVIAATEFGARAVGIEIGPVQYAMSWGKAVWNGLSSKVRVEVRNFYRADLSPADVVFAYLTSDEAAPLQDKLRTELKPGARVVTVAFNFPNWEPHFFDRENLIYLYRK